MTVNIVRMLYRDCQAQVICGNKLTEPFIIQTGVKQGCILSLFLFSLRIDRVMKNGKKIKEPSDGLSPKCPCSLDFADDRCLLAHRPTDMQAMTEDQASTAAMLGLKVTRRKPST